jgi:hypothetical protein
VDADPNLLALCAAHRQAQLRGISGALSGDSAQMYPGGEEQRNSEIESGRGRSGLALHRELGDACERLEDAFGRLTEAEWSLPVLSRRGPIPVHEVLMQRWLDVEVHMIHLDIGQTVDGLSEQLVEAYLPTLVAMLPALRRRPDADHSINGSWLLVRAGGDETWRICADGAEAHECEQQHDPEATIAGSGQQLFGVLLGRLDPAAIECTNVAHATRFKRAFPGP